MLQSSSVLFINLYFLLLNAPVQFTTSQSCLIITPVCQCPQIMLTYTWLLCGDTTFSELDACLIAFCCQLSFWKSKFLIIQSKEHDVAEDWNVQIGITWFNHELWEINSSYNIISKKHYVCIHKKQLLLRCYGYISLLVNNLQTCL